MKNLETEDLHRLAIEIGQLTDDADSWAENSGFPLDVLNDVGRVGKNAVYKAMREAADEYVRSIEESGDIPEDGEMLDMTERVDLGGLIENACIFSFVLGYETRKEFGG